MIPATPCAERYCFIFMLTVTAITVLYWTVLILHVPVFELFPGWPWTLNPKPIGSPAWLLLLVIVPATALALVLVGNVSAPGALICLIVTGITMQYGMFLLDGQGLRSMYERMVSTGGQAFVDVAVQHSSILDALRNYESVVAAQQVGQEYLATKPPGYLAIHMYFERLARCAQPPGLSATAEQWFWMFCSYTWPAISQLVLVPLYLLGVRVFDEARARLACCFYVFIPPVDLITLHMDQTFFPLIFMVIALVGFIAFSRGSFLLASVTGLITYLAVYLSFGLGIVMVFLLGMGLFTEVSNECPGRLSMIAKFLIGCLLGAIAMDFLFTTWLQYDLWLRFTKAIGAHHTIMGWAFSVRHYFYFPLLNFLEFSVLIGLAVSLLALWSLCNSVLRAWNGSRDLASMMPIIVWCTLLILSLSGMTRGVVARLWLFFVPCVCLVAADAVVSCFKSRYRWAAATVCVLQWGTVLLTKTALGL